MDLLALHGRGMALRVLCALDIALVAILGRLGPQSALGGLGVAVVELAVDHLAGLVHVLLGKDLRVLDGLHDATVVVLVDFLVDGCLDLLVLHGLDSLVRH